MEPEQSPDVGAEKRPYRSPGGDSGAPGFVRAPLGWSWTGAVTVASATIAAVLLDEWANDRSWHAGWPIGIVFGLFVLGGSSMFLFMWWIPWSRVRRLRRSLTSIREARHGRVCVRGRILASDSGVFTAHGVNEDVVWDHIEASDSVSDLGVVLRVTAARDFLIDDGSGETAYVVAGEATVFPPPSRELVGSDPRLQSLLDAFPRRFLPPFGSAARRAFDWEESILKPGDEVIVCGCARREIRDVTSGLPMAQLVFAARGGPVGELLVAFPSFVQEGRFAPFVLVVIALCLLAVGILPFVIACGQWFTASSIQLIQ